MMGTQKPVSRVGEHGSTEIFTPGLSNPGCHVRNKSDPSTNSICSGKGKSGHGFPAPCRWWVSGRGLQATVPKSESRANHPDFPPHLSHVSLRLSNLIESDKLFISVPPGRGRGGRSLPNVVPQGSSQSCEAVEQPRGHLFRSFLSGLTRAWAAESPGHKEVPSQEASSHQRSGHTHDVLHGKGSAAPCHREICGGDTRQISSQLRKAGHKLGFRA